MNNVPDPLLAGKELPTFKFALEKSEGKVIGNSYGKEATVKQLPISKGIAGVSMRLEPGAMRELHWHATAAEWAFVARGARPHHRHRPAGRCRDQRLRARATSGTSRAATATCSQCLGDEPCHFILIFDNGYFSEFGTFSITDWIGHTPKAAAGEELRPARVGVRRLPEGRSLLRPRADAAREAAAAAAGLEAAAARRTSTGCSPSRRIATYQGRPRVARSIPSRFPISKTITGVVLDLEPGGAARAALAPERRRVAVRHRGPGQRHAVRLARPLPDRDAEKGDVGYIPQGYGHSIENVGDKPARILIGFNTGIYETIDLSQWIAGNPADVLATNFGKPAALFEKFPASRRVHREREGCWQIALPEHLHANRLRSEATQLLASVDR